MSHKSKKNTHPTYGWVVFSKQTSILRLEWVQKTKKWLIRFTDE